MFDHTKMRRGRPRHGGDDRFQMGRHLREELRRGLRQGHGHPRFAFDDVFGGGRRGAAVRRGEVRPLILAALRDKPMHGYEVIQELEAQSGGRWRPSAGSIYPTLQQLADEGLVTGEDIDGRRIYTITERGRALTAESGNRSPWTDRDDESGPDVRKLAMQVVAAAMQVQRIGSGHARGEADRILTDARKQLYRLLSEDEEASAEEEATDPSAPDAGDR
jgi:DNA-binding PadR family transcriptional regulator